MVTADPWREISRMAPLSYLLCIVPRTTFLPRSLRPEAGLLSRRKGVLRRKVWVMLTCRCLLLERVLFSLFMGALQFPGSPWTKLLSVVPP